MATVMNAIGEAIGEATGMRPSDDLIGMATVQGAKMKAEAYLRAILETTNPQLRHLLTTHLQTALAEHERCSQLMIKRGWYKAEASAEDLVKQALEYAKPVVQ